MQRVTIRMPERQVEQVDSMVERGEYPNRSEAIRECVRFKLRDLDEIDDDGPRSWRKV